MTILAPIAMFGWLPVVVFLFSRVRPTHRAVIAGFLLAWMYLPQAVFKIPVIPAYTKTAAAGYGILLGAFLLDRRRLGAFRFQVWDVPVLLWCACPMGSSLSNRLGFYDGLSAMEAKVAEWFIPYFIGRVYFSDQKHLRDLSVGLFMGALLYIPLCWFEFVLSPQLHRIVYGFHPHEFGQSKRAGGWRPVVFMKHGLMTSMWMVSGTLAGWWLFLIKNLGPRIPLWRIPSWVALVALSGTTLLLKSFGALALLGIGGGTLLLARQWGMRLPLVCIAMVPVAYEVTRGTGWWDAQSLIRAAAAASNEDRAESLAFRIRNENQLIERALERPWFGWGGWQRSFVVNERGVPISVPDGLWIVALGQNGLVGLGCLTLTLVLPQCLFLRRYPPKRWGERGVGAIAPLSVLLGLFMIDNLFNDMFNPTMLLSAGGMTGLATEGVGEEEEVEEQKGGSKEGPRGIQRSIGCDGEEGGRIRLL